MLCTVRLHAHAVVLDGQSRPTGFRERVTATGMVSFAMPQETWNVLTCPSTISAGEYRRKLATSSFSKSSSLRKTMVSRTLFLQKSSHSSFSKFCTLQMQASQVQFLSRLDLFVISNLFDLKVPSSPEAYPLKLEVLRASKKLGLIMFPFLAVFRPRSDSSRTSKL